MRTIPRLFEAPWLAWASQAADLTRAVPSLFRHGPAVAMAEAAVWAGALLSAWGACRVVARHARLTAGSTVLLGLVLLGAASTAAVTVNWRIEGVGGMRSLLGQLRGLEAAATHGAARAVLLDARTSMPVAEGFAGMRIAAGPAGAGEAGNWPLLPYLPAGRYRLWADLAGPWRAGDRAPLAGLRHGHARDGRHSTAWPMDAKKELNSSGISSTMCGGEALYHGRRVRSHTSSSITHAGTSDHHTSHTMYSVSQPVYARIDLFSVLARVDASAPRQAISRD